MTSFEPIAASASSHHPSRVHPPLEHHPFSDPNRLAPEDAFFARSPPKRRREDAYASNLGEVGLEGDGSGIWKDRPSRRKREKERGRSGSRRRKGEWKKLLWVRHPGCRASIFNESCEPEN